ncbi:MAG: transketolase [Rhodobacteraceae bacterium]|nr:transketolase [Paracoccaceae bacterium]
MELHTRVHARSLAAWGRTHPDSVVLSGDLTASCEADEFRDTCPGQFISMGLAEQNMMSFAAGLAREGLRPLVHTFGVFMYRRALDQVEMSIACPNLPVRLFGFLPGVTTPGGASHQSTNDIAVLRSLPNMTILETGDATDVESILPVADSIDGPVYCRMLRGALPRLFPHEDPLRLGKARILSDGNDIALLTSGICTEEAMRAVDVLRRNGVGIRHLHVTTLKPFDDADVMAACAGAALGVITMENHLRSGGLGSAVAELIAEQRIDTRQIRIGIDDTYMYGASPGHLMNRFSIDVPSLIRAVEELAGQRIEVSVDDINAARTDTYYNEKQQEAL